MHKTVPMYMTTLSNTLVYTCEWVFLFCFTLLYCKCFFPCVLCCLIFIDVLHIQMQLMQRLDLWNEFVRVYVCMYVCMYECTGAPAPLSMSINFNCNTVYFRIVQWNWYLYIRRHFEFESAPNHRLHKPLPESSYGLVFVLY